MQKLLPTLPRAAKSNRLPECKLVRLDLESDWHHLASLERSTPEAPTVKLPGVHSARRHVQKCSHSVVPNSPKLEVSKCAQTQA